MSQIRHPPRELTTVSDQSAGARIDRHRHDDHQLVYVSTGVVAVQTAEGGWVAARDRAVWIPAGTWHQHRFYGASVFHTVGFPVAEAPLPSGSPTVVPVGNLLRELLVACTDAGLGTGEARRIRAVVRDRLRDVPRQPVSLPAARDPRLADACEQVLADLATPLPAGLLARRAGTSERTLARLFRSEMGMTYPQWRTRARVFEAMVQLASGLPVTTVSHRCGWASPSAFIDTFRRSTGQTPGEYRVLDPHR